MAKKFGGKGAVLVAEVGDWTLFEFPEKGNGTWRAFKLDSRGWRPRGLLRAYWFGWNGERLSDSNDVRRLRRERPGLHAALLAALQQSPAAVVAARQVA